MCPGSDFKNGGLLETVRILLSKLEKFDGQRSRCPRCDGSGLFLCQKAWLWNRASQSNDPCWFCEGVGVMPLYGLHGFMLGRASAAVRTEVLREAVDLPAKLQLYLGKNPGTNCKFRSYKSIDSMSKLLYRPSETPTWLIDAAEELTAASPSVTSEPHDGTGNFVSELGGTSLTRMFLSTALLDRLSSRLVKPRSQKSLVRVDKSEFVNHPDQFKTIDSRITVETRGQRGIIGGRVPNERRSPIPWMLHLNPTYTELQLGRKAQVEENSDRTRRRVRSARRNRIRQKAEREAVAKAAWMKRSKESRSDESSSATPSDHSDSLLLISGRWRQLAQDWLAEEIALVRQSVRASSGQSEVQAAPNLAIPASIRAKVKAASDLPSASRLLFADLVKKLRSIQKSFKLWKLAHAP